MNTCTAYTTACTLFIVNSRHRGTEAKKHRGKEAQRHRGKNFEDKFLRNRWTFIKKKSAFVHNFWFPATFITDKFWSDSRLRRSRNFWWHFRSSDTFGDTFSSPSVTLWRPLVTLLRRLRLPKINFGTFQLGIAQLVPRVSGSPSPLPAPKPCEKKKIPKKKFRTLPPAPSPPPYWLEIDGSDRKKYHGVTKKTVGVPAGHETSRWTELSPGRRSSHSLSRALVRLLQPDPHRAPKVNQSNQTSLHRYLPWPINSTLTS